MKDPFSTRDYAKPDYANAEQLARAMCLGIEEYRQAPPLRGEALLASGLDDLANYADLQSLPPLARPGRPGTMAVRLARVALRALLRPWLAVQTQFNRGMLEEVARLRQQLDMLARSSPGTTSADEEPPVAP